MKHLNPNRERALVNALHNAICLIRDIMQKKEFDNLEIIAKEVSSWLKHAKELRDKDEPE